jgi:conjugal transfer pilus assembly protein TraU
MQRFGALWLCSVLFGLLPGLAFASEPFKPGCPDAQVFSTKLLTDICWSCVFPIRIAGIDLGGGSRPAGASDQTFCVCQDPLGLPEPGITMGFWAPARLIEVVRMPYCSPSLGSVFLRRFTRLLGHRGDGAGTTAGAYYHYHYFAFPLLVMLDLFLNDPCHSDGYYVDFDLLYLSELDPTWNSDELAFFVNPETALFANPPALAACLVDAGLATAGQPQDSLFWCAGTWGNLYPLTGRIPWGGTPPRDAALIATRATAALHRRGLAWQTMGNDALCRAHIQPVLPKSQYKLQQFYPVAEANGNHWIGESAYRWGAWRNIPATGEDFVQVLWTWKNCCLR